MNKCNENNYNEDKENECPICFSKINSLKNFCVTKCGHSFCFTCILRFLKFTEDNLDEENDFGQEMFVCPLCRSDLLFHENNNDEKEEEEEDNDEENEENNAMLPPPSSILFHDDDTELITEDYYRGLPLFEDEEIDEENNFYLENVKKQDEEQRNFQEEFQYLEFSCETEYVYSQIEPLFSKFEIFTLWIISRDIFQDIRPNNKYTHDEIKEKFDQLSIIVQNLDNAKKQEFISTHEKKRKENLLLREVRINAENRL